MSKIEINNVYKIFGNNPSSVLPMVKDGATKDQILEQTGHTVGLDNVSLKIEEGETFVLDRLTPHQLFATDKPVKFIEISTFHDDTDSYRVWR